jgi:hypothetical protein
VASDNDDFSGGPSCPICCTDDLDDCDKFMLALDVNPDEEYDVSDVSVTLMQEQCKAEVRGHSLS